MIYRVISNTFGRNFAIKMVETLPSGEGFESDTRSGFMSAHLQKVPPRLSDAATGVRFCEVQKIGFDSSGRLYAVLIRGTEV